MGRIKLGRTGLVVEKQGFGCLPIQRISKAEAVELLHRAYDGGTLTRPGTIQTARRRWAQPLPGCGTG